MTARQTRLASLLRAGVLIAATVLASTISTSTAPDGVVSDRTLTLLPDGQWLALGGIAADGSMARPVVLRADGSTVALSWTLREPRTGHTATMLADGRILILGGVTRSGQLATIAEIIDPTAGSIDAFTLPVGLRRAFHTATLLLDGSVVVVGGVDTRGRPADAGSFDPTTEQFAAWGTPPAARRTRHTAELGDAVVVEGGTVSGAAARGVQEYVAATQTIVERERRDRVISNTALVETSPADGASDVAMQSRIGLRFSGEVFVTSATDDNISLVGPQGRVPARIVVAEGGRLIFLVPADALESAARYRVVVRSLTDRRGVTVANATVTFTTIGGQGQAADNDDEDVANAERSTWRQLPPLKSRSGDTALAGQVLRLNGNPLEGVTLRIGSRRTTTDRTGRFLLSGLSAGHAGLLIDGRSASTHGRVYGVYEAGVEILPGRTTALPYTIWMTKLDTAHAVRIASPTTSEVVVTTPRLPGLELRIPAGTTIRNEDGRVVAEISITPIPIAKPPFPLPRGVQVPIYFTIQPGGAYLRNTTGRKATLVYPNSFHQPVGTPFDFWNYDPDERGWYVYGQGVVAPGARQILPNPGIGIYEFTGAMVATTSLAPSPPNPSPPPGEPPGPPTPNNPSPGSGSPPEPPGTDGDPVDLSTGLFVYSHTDAVLDDVWPIRLQRVYRPGDSRSRPFGLGTTHNYELLLLGDTNPYTFVELVLPNGGRVHYNRTSSGTTYSDAVYEHTATPSAFYKSTVRWNNGGWELTLRNGLIYRFPDSLNVTTPAMAALIGLRDRYGNTVTLKRNSSGDLTSIISPNNRTLSLSYDSSHRITAVADSIGRTVSYTYDTSGRLSTVTDPDSGTTQFTYDSSHRMLTLRDRRGNVFLTNDYDSSGRVWRQTRIDSTTYEFAYTTNGSGVVTQTDVTDPAGFVRRSTFNSSGYITGDTLALGESVEQAVTYTRNSANQITAIVDALGRQTSYTYDTAGNVSSVTFLAGTGNAVTTSFTYTSDYSRLVTVTDPLSHTWTLNYDALGNVESFTDPLNHQVSYTYTTAGLLRQVIDPLNQVTTIGYDGGALTSVTDPLGNRVGRHVDLAGRTAAITDATGHQTRWTYDALDRVASVTDALGGVISMSYDANGNVLSVTDPQSHAIQFTYDQLDQRQTRTDPLSQQDAYVFNSRGLLEQVTDRNAYVTQYDYDALGRLTMTTYDDTSTTQYTYDDGNRVTQIVDSIYGTVDRSFDGLDRLLTETTPQGQIDYTYDAAGRRTSQTVSGQTAISYSYDNANHLTAITQGTTVVGFTYDVLGRRATTTHPNGVVVTYSYDAASRLVQLAYANAGGSLGNLTYSYDATGNRVAEGGSLATTVLPSAVTASYDAANRLSTWGSNSPTYDLAGNLTGDGTNSYSWDVRNRLAAISGGSTAAFAYDPLGRRSMRTVGSTTTYYLYDGPNAVQELNGSGPTANMIAGGGVDETLVRSDASGTRSLVIDALGSTIGLTNGSGAFTTQYSYGAHGIAQASGSASTNSSQFAGRDNDGTGLVYMRARYYSPTLHRFIADDPIGLDGGINLTTYAANNPLRWTDPSGLKPGNPNDDDPGGPGRSGGGSGPGAPGGPGSNEPWQQCGSAACVIEWLNRHPDTVQLGEMPLTPGDLSQLFSGLKALRGLDVLKNGFRHHGINSVVDRGVNPKNVLDALRNPVKFIEGVNEEGPFLKWVGKRATLIFNDDGQLITLWGNRTPR